MKIADMKRMPSTYNKRWLLNVLLFKRFVCAIMKKIFYLDWQLFSSVTWEKTLLSFKFTMRFVDLNIID